MDGIWEFVQWEHNMPANGYDVRGPSRNTRFHGKDRDYCSKTAAVGHLQTKCAWKGRQSGLSSTSNVKISIELRAGIAKKTVEWGNARVGCRKEWVEAGGGRRSCEILPGVVWH